MSVAAARRCPLGVLLSHIGPDVINDVAKLANTKLKESNAEAIGRHDYLAATLSRFRLDLEEGERKHILLPSSAVDGAHDALLNRVCPGQRFAGLPESSKCAGTRLVKSW